MDILGYLFAYVMAALFGYVLGRLDNPRSFFMVDPDPLPLEPGYANVVDLTSFRRKRAA